jgi:general secretion pathway protein I
MARAILRQRHCRGFTLIEVLVAIAILTIALTSIYRLQSDTFRMSADARFYAMAPLLAQQQLSALERQGLSNATDGSGDFGQEYPGYQWAVRIEDAAADLVKSPQQHLIRIDVVVTGDANMSYELRAYRFYVDE